MNLSIRTRMVLLSVVAFQLGIYWGPGLHGTAARVVSAVAIFLSLILICDSITRRPWKKQR